jgi:predicted nucleic acid-binding protein
MILDTNAISDLLLENRALLRALPAHSMLRLPVIALGEYRYGIQRSREKANLGRLLDRLESFAEILPVDPKTVSHYAIIREKLREQGYALPQNDIWIAAIAVQHDLPIVSRDAHFDYVRDVRRISW